MLFVSFQKLFSFLRYLNIRPLNLHFGYVEKRFDKKGEVNFKIYDVTTDNLRRLRQSGYKIWSVNKV